MVLQHVLSPLRYFLSQSATPRRTALLIVEPLPEGGL